jgi:hypothetical protein
MGRVLFIATVAFLAGCGSDDSSGSKGQAGADGGVTVGPVGGSSSTTEGGGGGGKNGNSGGAPPGAAGRGYPDAFDPNDSPPKIGQPGCGLDLAAFCDTFGAPATTRGRGGELDAVFWSGSRMHGQLSTTRAMGIGMAVIPNCRPGLPTQVWPDDDALICNPTFDVKSGHLLVAVASQNYGQNGYRIRQPFDFSGRTGKIVFDASTDPMSPLHGWVSLAITEDPISMPGYSIQDNDEGSIIPKNALEIHFANYGGQDKMTVRYIHVFKDYVDTVYAPPDTVTPATHVRGKTNHFEVTVAQDMVEVHISPSSDDGVTFGEPMLVYKQPISMPISRGYVHLSVHNHASIKYTMPDSGSDVGIVDAPIARFDNVGFDGPVITNWRESEVPDSLVQFNDDPNFEQPPDPYNVDQKGIDIGYVLQDASKGPGQTLTLKDVDTKDVVNAKISLTFWVDFLTMNSSSPGFTLQGRLNGHDWISRQLNATEAKFFNGGPTTLDASGQPMGKPGSQGRLALMFDVPATDLVDGDNTLELVTTGVPTSYPPLALNIDLVMETK